MATISANCGGLLLDAEQFELNSDKSLHIKGGTTTVSNATKTKAGVVKQSALVADASGDAPTKAEFDALLTALKNAGIMATS